MRLPWVVITLVDDVLPSEQLKFRRFFIWFGFDNIFHRNDVHHDLENDMDSSGDDDDLDNVIP